MDSILIISAAIFLGFFIQTTLGFAATLVALPFLLLIMDIQEAMALMSIFLVIFSFTLIPHTWKKINKKMAISMALYSLIGLIIGVQILKISNPYFLKKILGIFIILYVIYTLTKKEKIKWILKAKMPFSLLGGLFSGLFSSGGPFFIIYINNKLHFHNQIRATIIGIFGIINISKIPLMIQADMLHLDIFIQSLYIFPAFILSIWAGNHLFKKIEQKTFKNILMSVLFIMGLLLIIK